MKAIEAIVHHSMQSYPVTLLSAVVNFASVTVKSKGNIPTATAGKGQSQPSEMYELSEDY